MILYMLMLLILVCSGWSFLLIGMYKEDFIKLVIGSLCLLLSVIGAMVGLGALDKEEEEENKITLQIQGENVNITYPDANNIVYNQDTGELTFTDSNDIAYSVTPAQLLIKRNLMFT